MQFKLYHTELEVDKSNLPDNELINFKQFVDSKFPIKTTEEEPNEEYRVIYNAEVT